MLGIPYRLLRYGEGGAVDKMIYLATRRCGEAGTAMRGAHREFKKHEFENIKLLARYSQENARDNADQAQLEAMLDEIAAHSDAADAAAEKMVLLSITANYGKDNAEGVMDELTSKDIRAMVTVIETGELPDGFFPAGAQPPKPTSTSPSGGAQSASSSTGDSPVVK